MEIKLEATILKQDNTSAQTIAENRNSQKRTRHMAVKYHNTQEKINSNEIRLVHVESKLNDADLLTKPLSKGMMKLHLDRIMSDQSL